MDLSFVVQYLAMLMINKLSLPTKDNSLCIKSAKTDLPTSLGQGPCNPSLDLQPQFVGMHDVCNGDLLVSI